MKQDPFFEREDKRYFENWLEKAKEGSATAIFMVADCFYIGKGTQKNIAEAERWYKLAASGGNFAAQAKLNEMFAKGEISEGYVPEPDILPKKNSTPSLFSRNKKSYDKPRKKSYDGNFGDVDAGLSALFNDEKAGYEENTYHFKESYGKKKFSNNYFDDEDDGDDD